MTQPSERSVLKKLFPSATAEEKADFNYNRNRLTRCTICNSLYVDKVDEMLLNGLTQVDVHKYLKGNGLILDPQSVWRHYHNHVLGDGPRPHVRQIHKKGIINVRNSLKKKQSSQKRAPDGTFALKPNKSKKPPIKLKQTASDKKTIEKLKKNAKDAIKDPDKVLARGEQIMHTSPPPDHISRNAKKRKLNYKKIQSQMEKDIDVVAEFIYVLAVAKDRVDRALKEEADVGLILPTTNAAIAEYGKQLKNFKEVTTGIESIQQLRFAQVIQMIGNVFTQQPITDKTRFELLSIVAPDSRKDGKGLNILPIEDLNSNKIIPLAKIEKQPKKEESK